MPTGNEYERLQRNPSLSRNQNNCKTNPNLCLFAFPSFHVCACARETEKGTEGWRERDGGGVYVESLTVAQAAEGRGASAGLATPTHFSYYFKFEV